MGSAIGGYFRLGGADVRLISPSAEHIGRINLYGLQMAVNNTKVKTIPARAYTNASEIGEKMDIVVTATKGHQLDAAIQEAQCLFGEDTICLTIQNGIGNADIFSRYLDEKRIYVSVAQLGAIHPEPGVVRVLKQPGARLSYGPISQEDPIENVQTIADVLTRGGLDAYVMTRSEINQKIWYKMTSNCMGNAGCAITNLPLGRFTNC